MGTADLGVWLGLIFSGGGVAGILLGGFVASRWFGDNERDQLRLSALSVALMVPCFVTFLTVSQKVQALIALMPLIMVSNFVLGPTYALLQRLVTDDMRATMLAAVMLLANLIGLGVGPQIVGILSDLLEPVVGGAALRDAMLILSFVSLLASYHFWKAARVVKEDLSSLQESHR
jgi:MFS family permease